jgi:type I restriction enzyme R subunit
MEEQEDLTDYINGLDWNSGQDEKTLRNGYETFKIEKIIKNYYQLLLNMTWM